MAYLKQIMPAYDVEFQNSGGKDIFLTWGFHGWWGGGVLQLSVN